MVESGLTVVKYQHEDIQVRKGLQRWEVSRGGGGARKGLALNSRLNWVLDLDITRQSAPRTTKKSIANLGSGSAEEWNRDGVK